jgi:hypothetical protein
MVAKWSYIIIGVIDMAKLKKYLLEKTIHKYVNFAQKLRISTGISPKKL